MAEVFQKSGKSNLDYLEYPNYDHAYSGSFHLLVADIARWLESGNAARQSGYSAYRGVTLKSLAYMDVSVREVHRSVSSNLVFETLWDLRLLVSYQGAADPTDAEWSNWIVAADALWKKAPEFRLLVVTDGGRPNRQQLDRLRSVKRSEPLTVIISSSTLVYFVASIVALFNPHIDCFSPAHRDRAYSRIGLAPDERTAVDAAISRLRQKIEEPAVTMGKGDRARW